MRLDLPPARYSTPELRQTLYRELEERFASIPGMRASFASAVPLDGAPGRKVRTESQPTRLDGDGRVVGQLTVGADYFGMLGTSLVRGRMFRFSDADADRVAVVNERFAMIYFPDGEAIGERVRLVEPGAADNPARAGQEWLTIVGVAPNIRQRSVAGGDFDPIVYVPVGFNAVTGTNIIVRSALSVGSVASVLRQELRAVDPDLPLYNIRTVTEQLDSGRWAQRFTSSLFTIFAGIALVLAVVGLYGVTAYGAGRRTKELGVRIALGAQSSHVWWLVTRGAFRQLAASLPILGAAGSVAVAQVLPAELSGASGGDPLTLVAVAMLLLVVGIAASFIPARRAMGLDPVTALRAE